MKVEVAKTKICHLSLSGDMQETIITDGKSSDIIYHPKMFKCICGPCMAWQYTEVQETKAMGTVHKKVVDVDHETEDGYCKRIENGK